MTWLAIAVPAVLTIVGGLAVIIWRVGGMSQAITDIRRRLLRVEQTLDTQEYRARRQGRHPTSPPSEDNGDENSD